MQMRMPKGEERQDVERRGIVKGWVKEGVLWVKHGSRISPGPRVWHAGERDIQG